jgi:hypothetical protein
MFTFSIHKKYSSCQLEKPVGLVDEGNPVKSNVGFR